MGKRLTRRWHSLLQGGLSCSSLACIAVASAEHAHCMHLTARVAQRLQVWPVAVLVAQACGQETLQAVLQSMGEAAFAPHLSPLHVFGLTASENWQGAVRALSSTSHAVPASPAAARQGSLDSSSPVRAPRAGSPWSAGQPHAHQQAHQPPQRKVFVPSPTASSRGEAPCAWHATLLMLAANRSPSDAVALGALGDRLWHAPAHAHFHRLHADADATTQDRAAAHVCYMLAGRAAESAFAPDSCFVLPGADHRGQPTTLLDAEALQRADMLAWCLQQSMGTPMYGMVPHYLVVRRLLPFLVCAKECATAPCTKPCACALAHTGACKCTCQ